MISKLGIILLTGVVSVFAAQSPDSGASTPVAAAPVPDTPAPDQWALVQSVDTMGDEGRGDWFKKKKILQDARRLYQELKHPIQQSIHLAQELSKKYQGSVQNISQQVAAVGIQQSEVVAELKGLNDTLEKAAVQPQPTIADKQHVARSHEDREMLNEFIANMTFVLDLQAGLTQALSILNVEIRQSQEYEKRAWKLYELIDAAFNDKIAAQLFEEMKTIGENVGLIESYLANDLKNYFERSIPLLNEHFKKGAEELGKLRDRGYFVQATATPTEQKTPAVPSPEENKQPGWRFLLAPFFLIVKVIPVVGFYINQHMFVFIGLLGLLALIPILFLVRWLLRKFKQ